MLIGTNYKVESDPLNVILLRRRGKNKNGTDKWSAEGYFATVKNALTYLVDAEVRGTGLVDLITVTKKQDELYRLIKSLDLRGEPPITEEDKLASSPDVSPELTPTGCGARGCGNGGGMELVAGVVLKHPGGRPEKQGEVSRTTA